MGYIDFNAQQNILNVISGQRNLVDQLVFSKINDEDAFSFIKANNETVGIKVEKFLSKVELKGYRAEQLFKELLDNVDIPYLHIGQSPGDHSRSLQDIKSKRPDFLINIPQLGILLFDVKCRRKVGFGGPDNKYFQISKEEIERLYQLQHKLLLPVWVAFLDEAEIYKIHETKGSRCGFWISSLTDLNDFLERLKANLSESDYAKISNVRIPDELLTIFSGDLNLKFGTNKLSEETLREFTDGYRFILAKGEKAILNCIKSKKIYKSYLKDEVKCYSMLKNEIDHLLTILISNNIVDYTPKEFLKLKPS
jgi:hypothetical protein